VFDCVNACYLWNIYGVKLPRCLASAFVPDWIDSLLAVQEVGAPMNCFLKTKANPAATSVREKVVLVLD
jgi:hypothetical protein